MSIFLRWGIFGILGVAGLMYAYNASKQMAAKRAARPPPVAAQSAESEPVADDAATPEAPAETSDVPPRCEQEFTVAQLARDARAQGQPLDRLLRMQEIAFQEPPRRARLEKVASFWFELASEPTPEELRDSAIRNCLNFN
jgi:hypothetical protein